MNGTNPWQVYAESIPLDLRQHNRWAVWKDEHLDGHLFEERLLCRPFKEYPGSQRGGALPSQIKKPAEFGADFMLTLHYLAFRADLFEGLAYLHENGAVEYFATKPEVAS